MLFDLTKLLSEPVGNNLENDIDDIVNTKEKFKAIGAYEPPVRNGYIDRELDDAIFGFQKEKGLKVDGKMYPGGETEGTLLGDLMGFSSAIETKREKPKDGVEKVAFPIILPALAHRLALYLGMSATVVWAWWQKQSTETRQKTLHEMNGETENSKAECDRQHEDDTRTCTRVARQKGKRAGAVCRSSASEIYASCLAGKPEEDWAPLQK